MQLLVLLLWTNLLLVAGLNTTLAQTTYKKGNHTTVTGLFTADKPSKDLSQFVGKADYLELNKSVLQQLIAEPPTTWSANTSKGTAELTGSPCITRAMRPPPPG